MDRLRRFLFAVCCYLSALTAFPLQLSAHSFGVRYDLPLPLWLYLTGAGAAIAISFFVIAIFLRHEETSVKNYKFNLLSISALKFLAHPYFLNLVRASSVALFILLLTATLFGNIDPFRNIAPTFVWVIWWVGMAFFSALVGNLWNLINPWKILFSWAANLFSVRGEPRPYPERLGYWPAFLLMVIFIWLELISHQGEQPRSLATLIIIYSAISWTGMAVFGQDVWIKRGELFSVIFSLLARFAPTESGNGKILLRFPAVGLLTRSAAPFSMVCFVLLVLTSVTFDGILETPLWQSILETIAESQFLRPFLINLQNSGINLIILIKTLALIVLPCVFIVAFILVSKVISRAGNYGGRTVEIAGYFVLSLVPIAIAYHLSHYLSYLLIAGQNIIPLLSDPFGVGWDLFGTAAYRIDIGIVNARLIWNVSVSAIVLGHALAVYIAHVMAMRVFVDRGSALKSQIPMLLLMVFYTMLSLWILSQPIIA